MILLDTNVLSELMKESPNPDVIDWVNVQPEAKLFISTVTQAEIELGIALLPDGKRKEALAAEATVTFEEFADRCLAFDTLAASEYGSIVAQRIKIGRPIAVEDGMIAAIALAHDLQLATRNIKDFEHIPELVIFNPWHGDGGESPQARDETPD